MLGHRGLQPALIGGLAILAAATLGAEAWSQAAKPPATTASGTPEAPTPKTTDGHTDFNGFWGGPRPGLDSLAGGAGDQFDGGVRAQVRNGDISNLTNDNVIARRTSDNLPLYKPEYWSKVQELDHAGNKMDPYVHCMPIAPPRIGPPAYIVQRPDQVIFFYRVSFERNDFRIIPIGPRTHPLDPDGTWTGDPVAHWDGDALVIETEGFNDQSWIDSGGYLHGYSMKTTERLRRVGDNMFYDVTVEDPEYLQKPWVLSTQTIPLQTRPNPFLEDAAPCSDRDTDHQVGTQREL